MQVIVDGWGRVVKEAEQKEYLKKLEFIPFKVQRRAYDGPGYLRPVAGEPEALLHSLIKLCACRIL